MPFKPATQVKCPKCTKSVYAAEERAVGDLKFHKECYKCSMCNKMLDSTNVNCHETVLYCKMCHGRKFGPKGYGFGGGAAGLSMDTGAHLDYGRDDKVIEYKAPKAAPGEGCPRCGGKVFAAEEMLAKGKVYHRTCFNCKTCRKPLDSVNHCDGPDKDVYCKVCYGKKYGPKGYGFGHGAGTLQSADPEANAMIRPHGEPDFYAKAAEGEEACPRCGGKVYSAEMMLAKGRPFHRKCFKCKNCTRPLDSMIHCDGPDGEVYCKLCYAKKYGPKGYGFASGSGGVLTAENIPGGAEMPSINPASAALDVTLIKAKPGEGCPRCGGKVFMAEEMFARGRSWHKSCYSCCHCHRPLDSVVGCDAPDGEVYCKLCYAKKYGPKGYGFASGGGGVLSAENIGATDDGLQQKVALASIDVAKIQAAEGTGCPRCGGKVFMAEEIHARGRSWHKHCYSCCHCHRPLDSVVGCDAPDGEVYCKLCYAKKYGPKGYGFASGSGGVLTAENIPGGIAEFDVSPASVAIDTTAILAKPGEGCPRCGGKVFSAEEMLSRYNKWHKRCYNCCDCHRPLDSMVQCDGPDGEIYCKLCYAKKYGPKGYGFASGAGGVLFPESLTMNSEDQSYVSLNPPTYATLDVKTLAPAKDGQSRCPRCGGAVFQAEAMVARNKEWHKQCYNCVECHRPLDSMIGCDAPDGEIYCKLCYAKRHGPKGYGYGHTAALVSLGTDDGIPCPPDIRQFGFGTGKARREGSVDQADQENRTTHQQKVIINQIRNLPIAGRVPRGAQDDQKQLPWVTEEEHTSQHTRGFSGFPASTRNVRTLHESDSGTTKTIITTKTVVRHVQESEVVKSSSSSSHVEMNNQEVESSDHVDTTEPEQVDGPDYEEVYRAPSIDSDEEEVPTSDFTTQTSPRPPLDIQSPPALAQEDPDINEPSESDSNQDLYLPPEPSNLSSQMHEQMSAMQKEMQQKMQQKLQHVSLNEESSAEAEVSIQAQHSAQISQEQVVTMKMERRVEEVSSHSEFSSSQMATSSHSESGVEASGEAEVALGNGTQSLTNIESIPTEEEE